MYFKIETKRKQKNNKLRFRMNYHEVVDNNHIQQLSKMLCPPDSNSINFMIYQDSNKEIDKTSVKKFCENLNNEIELFTIEEDLDIEATQTELINSANTCSYSSKYAVYFFQALLNFKNNNYIKLMINDEDLQTVLEKCLKNGNLAQEDHDKFVYSFEGLTANQNKY